MPKINKEVEVELTARNIAKLFCTMDSDEQAKFFSECAREMESWDGLPEFQFQWITDSEELTKEGRAIMAMIGEYAYQE